MQEYTFLHLLAVSGSLFIELFFQLFFYYLYHTFYSAFLITLRSRLYNLYSLLEHKRKLGSQYYMLVVFVVEGAIFREPTVWAADCSSGKHNSIRTV